MVINVKKYFLKIVKPALTLPLLCSGSLVHAAFVDLANKPLTHVKNAETNSLIVVDDSGSMDFLVTLTPDAAFEHSSEVSDVVYDSSNQSDRRLDYTPDTNKEKRRLCAKYNALAFDPDVEYEPWQGFGDRPIGGGWVNPGESETKDLSGNKYVIWEDGDNDGIYDSGECTTVKSVTDLSDIAKVNYANWYSYYRKRIFVAKAALLSLVDTYDQRLGLATLHRRVGVEVDDVDDGDSTTTADADHKQLLRDKIIAMYGSGGTPTRDALYDAGLYFAKNQKKIFTDGSGTTDSPIFNKENGGACQKNTTVLMSDGYAKSGSPGLSDKDGDGESDTLADIAYYFYNNDSLYVENDDGNDFQVRNMVTNTVSFGVEGSLDSDGCIPGTISDAGVTCGQSWPQNISWSGGDDPQTIDDMWHAAVNSDGSFFNAANVDDLESAFNSGASDSFGSAGALASSSVQATAGTLTFSGSFDGSDWSGTLRAFDLDSLTSCAAGVDPYECGDVVWDAAAELLNKSYSDRVIMTSNSNTGMAFRWPTTSSPGTQTLTSAFVKSGESDYGENLVNFIRGDRQFEQGIYSGADSHTVFRRRTMNVYTDADDSQSLSFGNTQTPLGDIVHSSPYYVGVPIGRFNDDDYETFKEDYGYTYDANGDPNGFKRIPMIYVGANDGMLHGFNAATGEELLAYVPHALWGKLEALADVDYDPANDHQYYVDGSLVVGDAKINGWQTILVGSLRGGGQSIFALNVTDPSTFSEANADDVVMWEFSDPDLGYTYSQPDITQLNDGRWVAIFGNGYNNSEDDGSPSTNGHGYLFVVNLETGALIRKIDTNSGSVNTPNGLSTVKAVDMGGDGKVDFVYAGDLRGQIYRFNLTSDEPSSWSKSKLFQVDSTDPYSYPITARPAAVPDPVTGNPANGILVMFGTGKYLGVTDLEVDNQPTQAFFAVLDRDPYSTPTTLARSDLLEQTVTVEQDGYRVTSDNAIDWASDSGWRLELTAPNANTGNRGERQIWEAQVVGDAVMFNTLIPSGDACNSGVSGSEFTLSYFNGGPLGRPVIDVNGDGVINSDDVITVSGSSVYPTATGPTVSIGQSRVFVNDSKPSESDTDVVCSLGSNGVMVCKSIGLSLWYAPEGRASWSEVKP